MIVIDFDMTANVKHLMFTGETAPPPGLDAVARARHGCGDPAGGGDLEMPWALNAVTSCR